MLLEAREKSQEEFEFLLFSASASIHLSHFSSKEKGVLTFSSENC